MKLTSTTTRKEYIVYLILWLAFAAAPILGMLAHVSHHEDATFQWSEVFRIWFWFIALFIAFLIHNFLLAPLLVYRHRQRMYFAGGIALVACFFMVQCANHPKHHHDMPPPPIEIVKDAPQNGEQPPMFKPEDGKRPIGPRPAGIGMFDITMLSLLIFLLGTNVGIKFYFKSENDAQRLLDIEHANLKQELEYLKYQVNPHFFMNTLNNIHALVDIDPEQAKKSIVELSHMMRYVLYDGAQSDIALDKGIIFLKNYIAIMRLRYSDNVDIKVSMPEHVPQVDVPPLITIPFVENAFKHGVSYVEPSFIHISLDIDSSKGNVVFSCRNSKHTDKAQVNNDKQGGVGLANVTKRLKLLYGDNYTLDIDNADNIFSVRLILPFKTTNTTTQGL